uniref:Uncharacterized protein n=2 Tax=Leptobrachium leishanense TaxID=445787 RepID=A0A8C5LVN3_9ANUR
MDTFWLLMSLFLQVSQALTVNSRNSEETPVKMHSEQTGEPSNLIKKIKPESHGVEKKDNAFEMLLEFGRWPKGQDNPKQHRSRCNSISQAWTRGQDAIYRQHPTYKLQLKVFTGLLKPVTVQDNLVRYLSKIANCCMLGFSCNRVRGLQGTLGVDGENHVGFYMDSEVITPSVFRVELHLEVTAIEQLTVIPVVTANGHQHNSFIQLRRNHITDLILDLRFLLLMLKETETAETVIEIMLGFHCIHNGYHAPCDEHGIMLLNVPFIALHYK